MAIGDLEIGIGLDFSKADAQLKRFGAKQLKLETQLDIKKLHLPKEICIDAIICEEAISRIKRQLQGIEVCLDIKEAERQILNLSKPVKITPHLDFVTLRKELREMEAQTETSLRKIEEMAVKSVQKEYKVKLESSFQNLVKALNKNSDSHVNVAPKAFQEVLKNQKLKIDRGGLLGRAASGILTGGFEGLGRRTLDITIAPLEKKLFTSLTQAGEIFAERVEKNGKMFYQDAADFLGFQSAKIFTKRIGELASTLDPLNYENIKNGISAAFKIASDTAIDMNVNETPFMEALKKASKEATDELQKGAIIAASRFGGSLLKAIAPFIQLNREIKLQQQAKDIEPSRNLVAKPSDDEETPKVELTDAQLKSAKEKGAAIINIGGFQQQAGRGGFFQEEQIESLAGRNAEVITIINNARDSGEKGIEEEVKKLVDSIPFLTDEMRKSILEGYAQLPPTSRATLENAVFRGASPEAETVTRLVKLLREEGVEDIQVIGYSGGSFDALDAVNLAERAGIEGVKGVGIGGPILPGFSPESENFRNVLGEADKFYTALFNLVDRGNRGLAYDMVYQEFSGKGGSGLTDEDRNSIFYKAIQAAGATEDAQGGLARLMGFNMPLGGTTPEGLGQAHWFERYIRSQFLMQILNQQNPEIFTQTPPSIRTNPAIVSGEAGKARGVQSLEILRSRMASEMISGGEIVPYLEKIIEQILLSIDTGNFQEVFDFTNVLDNLFGADNKKFKETLKYVQGPLREWIDDVFKLIKDLQSIELPKITDTDQQGQPFERFALANELPEEEADTLRNEFQKLKGRLNEAVASFKSLTTDTEEVSIFADQVRKFVKTLAKENPAFKELAKKTLQSKDDFKFLLDPDLLATLEGETKAKFLEFRDYFEQLLIDIQKLNLQAPDSSDLGLVDLAKYRDPGPRRPKPPEPPVQTRLTDTEKLFNLLGQGFESLTKSIDLLQAKLKEIDVSEFDKALIQVANDFKARLDTLLTDVSKNLEMFEFSTIRAEEALDFLSLQIENLPIQTLSKELQQLYKGVVRVESALERLGPETETLSQEMESLNRQLEASYAELMTFTNQVAITHQSLAEITPTAELLRQAFDDLTHSTKALQKAREADFFETLQQLVGDIPPRETAATPTEPEIQVQEGPTRVQETAEEIFDRVQHEAKQTAEEIEKSFETIDVEAIIDRNIKQASTDKVRLTSTRAGDDVDLETLGILQLKELVTLLLGKAEKLRDAGFSEEAFSQYQQDAKKINKLIETLSKTRLDKGINDASSVEVEVERSETIEVEAETLEKNIETWSREVVSATEELELFDARLQQITGEYSDFLERADLDPGRDIDQQFIEEIRARDQKFAAEVESLFSGGQILSPFEEAIYDAFDSDAIENGLEKILNQLTIQNVDTLIIENLKNILGLGVEGPGVGVNKEPFIPREEIKDPWEDVAVSSEEAAARVDEYIRKTEEFNREMAEYAASRGERLTDDGITAGLGLRERAEGLGGTQRLTEQQREVARKRAMRNLQFAQDQQELSEKADRSQIENLRERVRDIAVVGGLLERLLDRAQKDILELEKREERVFQDNPNLIKRKRQIQFLAEEAGEFGEDRVRDARRIIVGAPETGQKLLTGTVDTAQRVETARRNAEATARGLETAILRLLPGLGRLKDDIEALGTPIAQSLDRIGDAAENLRERVGRFGQADIPEVPTQSKKEISEEISKLNRETGKLKTELLKSPGNLPLFEALEEQALNTIKRFREAQEQIRILEESGQGQTPQSLAFKATIGNQGRIATEKLFQSKRLLLPNIAEAARQGTGKDELIQFIERLIESRQTAAALLRQQGNEGREYKAIIAGLSDLTNLQSRLRDTSDDIIRGLESADTGLSGTKAAKAYLQAFKKALKIQSPSKEMESAGEDARAGFEQGAGPSEFGILGQRAAKRFSDEFEEQIQKGGFLEVLNNQLKGLQEKFPALRNLKGLFQDILVTAVSFAGVFSFGDVIGESLRQSITNVLALRRQFNALAASLGSVGEASSQLSRLVEVSSRLNISVTSAREGFTRLAASAKENTLVKEIPGIFEGISTAVSALQLSQEQAGRAFEAFAQIISKGVVSQEELRQQLAESIPGSSKIFADALGISTAQLNELIEAGALAADRVLPQVGKQLKLTFASSIEQASRSFPAAITRIQNSVTLFLESLGSGIAPILQPLIGRVSGFLEGLAERGGLLAQDLTGNFVLAIALLEQRFGILGKILNFVTPLFRSFIVSVLGRDALVQLRALNIKLLQTEGFMSRLPLKLQRLGLTLRAIGKIAFESFKTFSQGILTTFAIQAAGTGLKALFGGISEQAKQVDRLGESLARFNGELDSRSQWDKAIDATGDFSEALRALINVDFDGFVDQITRGLTRIAGQIDADNDPLGLNNLLATAEQIENRQILGSFGNQQERLTQTIGDAQRALKEFRVSGEGLDFKVREDFLRELEPVLNFLEEQRKNNKPLFDKLSNDADLNNLRKTVQELKEGALASGAINLELLSVKKTLSGLETKELLSALQQAQDLLKIGTSSGTSADEVRLENLKEENLRRKDNLTLLEAQAQLEREALAQPENQQRLEGGDPEIKKRKEELDKLEKEIIKARTSVFDTELKFSEDVIKLELERLKIKQQQISTEQELKDVIASTKLLNDQIAGRVTDSQAEGVDLQNRLASAIQKRTEAQAELNRFNEREFGNLDQRKAKEKELIAVFESADKARDTFFKSISGSPTGEKEMAALSDRIRDLKLELDELKPGSGTFDPFQDGKRLNNLQILMRRKELERELLDAEIMLSNARANQKGDDANEAKQLTANRKKALDALTKFRQQEGELFKDPNQKQEEADKRRLDLAKADNEVAKLRKEERDKLIQKQIKEIENEEKLLSLREKIADVSVRLRERVLESFSTLATALSGVRDTVAGFQSSSLQNISGLLTQLKELPLAFASFRPFNAKDFKEVKTLLFQINGLREGIGLAPINGLKSQRDLTQQIIKITRTQNQIELDLIKKKADSLLKEQDIRQKLLEIEIQRSRLEADRGVRQAESTLRKAQIGGDPQAIAEALEDVRAARAEQKFTIDEIALKRAILDAQQEADRVSLNAELRNKLQERRSGTAEALKEVLNGRQLSKELNRFGTETSDVGQMISDKLGGILRVEIVGDSALRKADDKAEIDLGPGFESLSQKATERARAGQNLVMDNLFNGRPLGEVLRNEADLGRADLNQRFAEYAKTAESAKVEAQPNQSMLKIENQLDKLNKILSSGKLGSIQVNNEINDTGVTKEEVTKATVSAFEMFSKTVVNSL